MRTIYAKDGPEISDLIVAFDQDTLARLPVRKSAVIEEFKRYKNLEAIKIVERIRAHNDILEERSVDRLLLTAHCELQRLSEEFYHGERVRMMLLPVLSTLRESGHQGTIRVVDIGCGMGFVIRWLSKYGALGEDVELVGADYNRVLVTEAGKLAEAEKLACRFDVRNAFHLEEPATICISTGVVHHFNTRDSLGGFFQNHQSDTIKAFFHFDFQPSFVTPLGSWIFHVMRMRQPLSRHDGVLSAARAHSGDVLLEACRAGAPEFVSAMYGRRFYNTPFRRVMQTLIGIRPALKEGFVRHLGADAVQLEEWK
ncbi:MAG TPA: class I SAM-dependent methyltransferase [Planktothrix sp.]|jgi:2-polyprenyl-3-methyl-5-hydroxy-6-metoxy-1,4-benzoquinol methylase